MITQEKVEVPAVKAHTKYVPIYICDICEYTSKTQANFRRCCLCDRLMCRSDMVRKGCSHDDPEEFGDYPDHYCSICYNLKYVKYIQERKDLEAEYDAKTEEIEERIKAESLATKKGGE